MNDSEENWITSPSRRRALGNIAGFLTASPIVASAQIDPAKPLRDIHRSLGLGEMRTAFDFEPIFEDNLPRLTYEFTAHGDGSEFNLRRNREAFDWVDILSSRPAIPASQVDLSSELLGVKMTFPILVAPSSGQNTLHPEGEIGMFRGATAAATMVDILSGATGATVRQALKAVPNGTMWGQYYPGQNLPNMQMILGDLQAAGSNVVVVTCDEQASVYERTLMMHNLGGRANVGIGGAGANAAAADAAAAAARAEAQGSTVTGPVRYRVSTRRLWYTWDYIDAVRKVVQGKLIIKGIIDPEDAKLAIDHGADAIQVSNHGGRSMDYGPSSLEALPEIVAAVKGRVPILFDGGVRRGSDVFKALALGANAVCLGRAARWGLGAFGAIGAQRVFEIIQQELVETAAATGCAKLSDINSRAVKANFV